jgi:hypothetical protein
MHTETTKNLKKRNEEDQTQVQLSEKLKRNDPSRNRNFNDSKYDELPTVPYNFTALVQELRLAKVFEPSFSSTNASCWCIHENQEDGRPTGLMYNKMPKAGSSTTSGVALRIANRVAARQHFSSTLGVEGDLEHTNTFKCSARVDHLQELGKVAKLFGNRDRKKSFLFSTIRDPAKRAISRIFFSKVRLKGQEPADEKMLEWLQDTSHQFGTVSPGLGGFQLAYVAMHPPDFFSVWDPDSPTEVSNPDLVHTIVREVLQDYDFMILVERYDECLIVMQLMLGLETSDLLFLSSKNAGSSYYKINSRECLKLKSSFVSPGVSEYISSNEWYAKSYGDYLLLEAASQSLDLTIEAFGRKRFDKALQNFKALKQRADAQCAAKAVFPCSPEGKLQNKEAAKSSCYREDWGCGYPCLDNVM